jgi:hypothetical protein
MAPNATSRIRSLRVDLGEVPINKAPGAVDRKLGGAVPVQHHSYSAGRRLDVVSDLLD